MKRLFKFKYPKLTAMLVLIVVAYLVFSQAGIREYFSFSTEYIYLWFFAAGLIFPFGFTTPFSIGLFLSLPTENPLFSALIAGVGAVISCNLIFSFIRLSFMDEFLELEETHPVKLLSMEIHKHFHKKVRNYLLYIFAGIIIASPLPDEIGVTMLAGLTHIKQGIFSLISFILSSFGMYLIILAAH